MNMEDLRKMGIYIYSMVCILIFPLSFISAPSILIALTLSLHVLSSMWLWLDMMITNMIIIQVKNNC